MPDIPKSEEYTEEGFWEKVKKYAKAIGCAPLCLAFKLFYTLDNPNLPTWAKTTIVAALAYLISPVDAIPDITPVVGYSDDFGVLAMAIGMIAAYVDDNAVNKAHEQVNRLVGGCDCKGGNP